jgi:hypothetical protein
MRTHIAEWRMVRRADRHAVDGMFIRKMPLRERNEVTDECMRDRLLSVKPGGFGCQMLASSSSASRPSPSGWPWPSLDVGCGRRGWGSCRNHVGFGYGRGVSR